MGDGSLIEINQTYLESLQTRVRQLKRERRSLEQATETAVSEFKSKYPDWSGNAGAAARSAYNEAN